VLCSVVKISGRNPSTLRPQVDDYDIAEGFREVSFFWGRRDVVNLQGWMEDCLLLGSWVLVWYGAVRYGMVRYGTVRYGMVQYGTVQCSIGGVMFRLINHPSSLAYSLLHSLTHSLTHSLEGRWKYDEQEFVRLNV